MEKNEKRYFVDSRHHAETHVVEFYRYPVQSVPVRIDDSQYFYYRTRKHVFPATSIRVQILFERWKHKRSRNSKKYCLQAVQVVLFYYWKNVYFFSGTRVKLDDSITGCLLLRPGFQLSLR